VFLGGYVRFIDYAPPMDWSEWWSRHSETVWATVAALIIAVAVGYYFWLKAEKPKHLGWEVLTSDRIIQVDEAQLRPQQLKMTFDDIEVKQPNLTIVRVGNSGKKEIRAADFDGDVDITFNEATLKTCTAARWSDDRMIPTLTTYDYIASRVSLSPLLLNPGDWIDIQCVTDGPLETPSITARIAGQTKSISSVVKRTNLDRAWMILIGVARCELCCDAVLLR